MKIQPILRAIRNADQDFEMIEDGDRIAVALSGGKDSMLLFLALSVYQKFSKHSFELCAIHVDVGFEDTVNQTMIDFAKQHDLELYIEKTKIYDILKQHPTSKGRLPCSLCSTLKKGVLFEKAKALSCNKIALGHHFDDVVETILLSMIYNGEFKTMMPILSSVNFKPIKLIRPLYYVREKDIISWVNYNNLSFIDCACKVTEKNLGKRSEIKKLIQGLNNLYKGADINIMNSTKNVNLNTIISYLDKKE